MKESFSKTEREIFKSLVKSKEYILRDFNSK